MSEHPVTVTDKRRTASTDTEPQDELAFPRGKAKEILDAADSADRVARQAADVRVFANPQVDPARGGVDPITRLMDKVTKFLIEQPEYYEILKANRSTRRAFERALVKTITRFPNLSKVAR